MNQVLRIVEQADRPSLSLELDPSTPFEEWVSIGRRLCLGQRALNWHIGDWWAFGDHRYGSRAKLAAEGIFGEREVGTLQDLGWVSRVFSETSERSEVVSWSCYRVTAALAEKSKSVVLELLDRVDKFDLSVRDLRREVQALNAENDPAEGSEQAVETTEQNKPLTAESWRSIAVSLAHAVIEMADGVRRGDGIISRRESDLLTHALGVANDATEGHRRCPDDFDVIFVEQGRLACETWYNASRITVNRWLIERGKLRLRTRRSEFVRYQREKDRTPVPTKANELSVPIDEAMHRIAKHAANFLRISRYGGWRISPTNDGEWLVGTVRKTPDQLIVMAERQGFVPPAEQLSC